MPHAAIKRLPFFRQSLRSDWKLMAPQPSAIGLHQKVETMTIRELIGRVSGLGAADFCISQRHACTPNFGSDFSDTPKFWN